MSSNFSLEVSTSSAVSRRRSPSCSTASPRASTKHGNSALMALRVAAKRGRCSYVGLATGF
eukprot:9240354-Pyramimonas_sp.AAC.1